NPRWITFDEYLLFETWGTFLRSVGDDGSFFGFLLIFTGIGSVVGGAITAIIVTYAKVADAILIGFILLFIPLLDVIIFPYHPTFYEISIFLTFFPFAWFGGKIVEVLYERNKSKKKNNISKTKNASG